MKNHLLLFAYLISSFLLFSSSVLASDSATSEAGFITQQHALTCIQTNEDLNLASRQMLLTETDKSHLKSKIDYLHSEIEKRRQLIEKLDRQNSHENNDNYNQLFTQFEDLTDERKQTISLYKEKNQLHITQHESVIRLEQRFSNECLTSIQITEKMHNEICENSSVRWCSLFKF